MKRGMMRLALLASALAVAACASPLGGGPMQERIENDLATFNAAYADAINNQMLWNVLRARDRLPTQYSGINAITSIQKRSVGGNFSLSSLDFGSKFAHDAWAIGTGGVSGSAEADPNYGITPLGGENFTKAVLSPTTPEVFDHYWQNGWPRDVLLGVLVKTAVKLSGDPDAALDGCLNAKAMQRLANKVDNTDNKSDAPFLVFARNVKTYGVAAQTHLVPLKACGVPAPRAAPAKPGKPGTGGKGPDQGADHGAPEAPRSLVLRIEAAGAAVNPDAGLWELDLRSLDEAVFYLGELVREEAPPADQSRGQSFGADLVTAADCHQGALAAAPLFRVTRLGLNLPSGGKLYAARLHYGGDYYAAGPAAALHPACRGPDVVDRTADVLDLLTQVLQANLTPDSLRSSVRFISN